MFHCPVSWKTSLPRLSICMSHANKPDRVFKISKLSFNTTDKDYVVFTTMFKFLPAGFDQAFNLFFNILIETSAYRPKLSSSLLISEGVLYLQLLCHDFPSISDSSTGA